MDEPTTLDEILTAARRDATAVEAGGHLIGYGDLRDWSLALARQWHRDGLVPGDRVVIVGRNSVDVLVPLFAAARLGLVAVLPGDRLTAGRLAHIIRHSDARRVLASGRLLRSLSHQDLGGADLTDSAAQPRDSAAQPRDSAAQPTDRAATGSLPAREVVLPPPPIGRDLALLIYTSGSTGDPKGVMLPHDSLVAGARIVVRYLGLTADDRVLSALPWSFDAGLHQVLSTFFAGGTLVVPRSSTPGDLSRALCDARITVLAGVPTLWTALMSEGSPFPRLALPDLRLITSTGGVLAQHTLEALRRAQPDTKIFLMYGLTEAFRSTYLAPHLVDQHPTCIGRAIPETEILVLDEHGRRCEPGEVGELVHRGPTVAAGYWRDPRATAEVFRPFGAGAERVVYSGDYVYRDEQGLLYFVERRDAQFKSLGHRVGPTEIERDLLNSGLVAEAVVIAREVAGAQTEISAVVVPRVPDTFTAEGLLAHCRAAMPRHLWPTRVVVVADLPRTPSGKIDRPAVRAGTP